MKYETKIIVWSAIGNTPITGRDGSYCDELVKVTIQCETPEQAKEITQRMVRETQHGYSGYFNMPNHPNQNIRNGFTH
jgi:hypothetical protein